MHAIFSLLISLVVACGSGGDGLGTRAPATAAPSAFALRFVDESSGRGVPLVEVVTVSRMRWWSDSAGYVAIDDPALLGRNVFFFISSHGHEYPADGFGNRGTAIDLKPGGHATLVVKRTNIAERLYRVTGEGIYRDSVILKKHVPIRNPLVNAQVTGQDSVHAVVYQGKIWWFWGDTMRQRYPIGHFSTSGATSALPGAGGLDPSVGVDLNYFVDDDGFSRPMVPPTNGVFHWIDGVVCLPDDTGKPRLLATLVHLRNLDDIVGRELIVWHDEKQIFQTLKKLDVKSGAHLAGVPVRHKVGGTDYLYCGTSLRVPANWKSVTDPASYEMYGVVESKPSGKLTWAWRKGSEAAAALGEEQIEALINDGRLPLEESPLHVWDERTKSAARTVSFGSVCWNTFRKKWIAIAVQRGGDDAPSAYGEIWYAEADAPQGPWPKARKIVTHDRYSFYNAVQHPFFDQDGGRVIYFDGTYATSFSREGDATPRYDYNQIMYRLDLADPRLE